MPILNQIQGGRWDEALRRMFSMKQGAVAPTIAAELVAAVILEDDRPENFILANTRLAAGHINFGPVALEFSQGQLFNPVGSGVLVVATSLIYSSTSNTTFVVGIGNVEADTANLTAVRLDTRPIDPAVGATFNPTAIINRQSSVAAHASTAFAQLRSLGNVSYEYQHAVILKPGFGLNIRPGVVNQSLICTFNWYERPLNPSEEFVP